MKIVSDVLELSVAKMEMYERLAEFVINQFDMSCVSGVLEAGCGSGQLTVPLAKKIGEKCSINERWFSPSADEVAVLMHKVGFRNMRVSYFETNLRLGYEAAIEQLKQWKIDVTFVKKHDNGLRKYGIEFPLEHVISCEKS